jgi:hypothetical protein
LFSGVPGLDGGFHSLMRVSRLFTQSLKMSDDIVRPLTSMLAIVGNGAIKRWNMMDKGGAHRLGFDAVA